VKPVVHRLDAKDATLAKLQELVGGYIDVEPAVCNEADCPGHDMAVNSDGKALGQAINEEASTMYMAAKVRRGIPDNPTTDVVVGDVVLVTGGRID